MSKVETGIIILAAGSSTRMGSPKQLLNVDGRPLILNAVRSALDSNASATVVVIGAHAEKIKPILMTLGAQMVVNTEWESGMGSSLKTGVRFLLDTTPALGAILVMVADQPFVSAKVVNDLMQKAAESSKQIVASSYQHTIGVPALFKQKYFPELLALDDHEGAKKLLLEFTSDVESVAFEKGVIDLDTPDDYDRFLNM